MIYIVTDWGPLPLAEDPWEGQPFVPRDDLRISLATCANTQVLLPTLGGCDRVISSARHAHSTGRSS